MKRRHLFIVVMACVLGAIAATPFGLRLEKDVGLSWLYSLRGPTDVPEGAAIIAIDERSVGWLQRNLGRLDALAPTLDSCLSIESRAQLSDARNVNHVPRGLHACLLEVLNEHSPALIVFDVKFNLSRADDELFAVSIRKSGRVVLLEGVETDRRTGVIVREHPAAVLRDAAAGVGGFHVEVSPGEATIRYLGRFPSAPDLDTLPTLAFASTLNTPPPPVAARQPIWLYGPAATVPTYTLEEAFTRDTKLGSSIRNTVVFVGASNFDAFSAGDHFLTPSFWQGNKLISGVELAATAYLNLRHGHVMADLRPWVSGGVTIAIMLSMALLAAVFAGWRGLVFPLLVGASFGGASAFAFSNVIWLPVVFPIGLGLPLAGYVWLDTRYDLARRLVRALAGQAYGDRMIRSTRAEPRSELASIMFIDLQGSTTLAAEMDEATYTDLLAEFYEFVGAAVDKHNGEILEYLGDGVIATFSEWRSGPQFAMEACSAARAISAASRAPPKKPRKPFRLRVGISTGPAMTGPLQAGERIAITALGDTVNTSARLQELGKTIKDDAPAGTIIIIDEATHSAASLTANDAVHIGDQVLRGRLEPTAIFWVDGNKAGLPSKGP